MAKMYRPKSVLIGGSGILQSARPYRKSSNIIIIIITISCAVHRTVAQVRRPHHTPTNQLTYDEQR